MKVSVMYIPGENEKLRKIVAFAFTNYTYYILCTFAFTFTNFILCTFLTLFCVRFHPKDLEKKIEEEEEEQR